MVTAYFKLISKESIARRPPFPPPSDRGFSSEQGVFQRVLSPHPLWMLRVWREDLCRLYKYLFFVPARMGTVLVYWASILCHVDVKERDMMQTLQDQKAVSNSCKSLKNLLVIKMLPHELKMEGNIIFKRGYKCIYWYKWKSYHSCRCYWSPPKIVSCRLCHSRRLCLLVQDQHGVQEPTDGGRDDQVKKKRTEGLSRYVLINNCIGLALRKKSPHSWWGEEWNSPDLVTIPMQRADAS